MRHYGSCRPMDSRDFNVEQSIMIHADMRTAEISMLDEALWFMQTFWQERFQCGTKHYDSCRHADSRDFCVGWSILVHADMQTVEISMLDEALWFMQTCGQQRFQYGMKHYGSCRYSDNGDFNVGWSIIWWWFMQTYRQQRYVNVGWTIIIYVNVGWTIIIYADILTAQIFNVGWTNDCGSCRHTDSTDFYVGWTIIIYADIRTAEMYFSVGWTNDYGSCRQTDSRDFNVGRSIVVHADIRTVERERKKERRSKFLLGILHTNSFLDLLLSHNHTIIINFIILILLY